MAAGANYAWANRQIISHWVREAFNKYFQRDVHLDLVYDVAHNVAKYEEHDVDGVKKTLCVHRKGATRAFGPGRQEVTACYRDVGQPVIIPGSMGSASYVLAGTQKAMEMTFGSTCHGAGRVMSRSAALRDVQRQRDPARAGRARHHGGSAERKGDRGRSARGLQGHRRRRGRGPPAGHLEESRST